MNEPKPRMKRLCLTLDDYTIAEAKRRGDGNLSLGIRRAFSHHRQVLASAPSIPASHPDSSAKDSEPV